MNTTFQDFIQMCVRKLRGEDDEEELIVDYVSATSMSKLCVTERHRMNNISTNDLCLSLIPQVEKKINNMTIKMPHQLFINGEFVDAEAGNTYKTINPTDGMVRNERQDENENLICKRQYSTQYPSILKEISSSTLLL